MVKREREKETVEDLKQAFRVFDKVNVNNLMKQCKFFDLKDGNGYVSTSELKFVMNKLKVHFSEQVSVYLNFLWIC